MIFVFVVLSPRPLCQYVFHRFGVCGVPHIAKLKAT